MPAPYVRFDEILFDTKKRKQFCKHLYREIKEFEEAMVADEEFYVFIKEVNKQAADLALASIEVNRRVLQSMKMTFLYYTGVKHSQVLDEDKVVDIFSLANY